LAAKRLPQPFGFARNVDQAWSTEDMAEFVSIATSDGELADVNLDQITHMRPNPANKSQIIIHSRAAIQCSCPAIGGSNWSGRNCARPKSPEWINRLAPEFSKQKKAGAS
jgi:hypothetical protein